MSSARPDLCNLVYVNHQTSHFEDESLKVRKSEGKTLIVVYVLPSKNKLYHLRNKIHWFTFIYSFLSNPALQ